MKTSGIYVIKNLVNGVLYVGSSINLSRRWIRHKGELNSKSHSNQKLQRAWDKYGEDSFSFSVIEEVPPYKDQLLAREQHWIDLLQCTGDGGYNILEKAYSHLGAKRSESTVAKLREINRGRSPSEESRKKMSLAKAGRKLNAEHRAKISAGNTGKKSSLESIKKRMDTEAKKPKLSGYVGVNLHKQTGKWIARVKRGGIQKSLGLYLTPLEAFEAREMHLAATGALK